MSRRGNDSVHTCLRLPLNNPRLIVVYKNTKTSTAKRRKPHFNMKVHLGSSPNHNFKISPVTSQTLCGCLLRHPENKFECQSNPCCVFYSTVVTCCRLSIEGRLSIEDELCNLWPCMFHPFLKLFQSWFLAFFIGRNFSSTASHKKGYHQTPPAMCNIKLQPQEQLEISAQATIYYLLHLSTGTQSGHLSQFTPTD